MNIFGGPRKGHRHDRPEPHRAETTPPSTPPFVILLPDASGIATYRLFSFATALEAERFVEVDLRGQVTHDRITFWAMPVRPAGASESLVLIRGDQGGAVHAFAFTEMESAREFLRHEMRAGLTLDRVIVYYAAPAALKISPDGFAAVSPPQPPAPFTYVRHPGPETYEPPARSEVHEPKRFQRWPESQPQEAFPRFAPPAPEVIDFPSAAWRLRSSTETAQWWSNMIDALDEALDAHVAKQVRGRIAWRRLSREIGSAAYLAETSRVSSSTAVHDEDIDAYDCDTGDDSWFIPRREWGLRPGEPFDGFGSPPGRF
jgi:hypothetical protein